MTDRIARGAANERSAISRPARLRAGRGLRTDSIAAAAEEVALGRLTNQPRHGLERVRGVVDLSLTESEERI